MPSYKFTYFDVRGRGELCRYVFYAAGRDFEDARVTFEQWAELKPKIKFGQLPILEVDGKELAQSYAIARYLAREFGLAGKTNWESACVDQYADLTNDLFLEIVKTFFEKDEEQKKEKTKKLEEEIFPKFLKMFERDLDANGGKYFVGDSLTMADLAVYCVLDGACMKAPAFLDSYPKLKAHRACVEALPKLAEYVKNRKQTDI